VNSSHTEPARLPEAVPIETSLAELVEFLRPQGAELHGPGGADSGAVRVRGLFQDSRRIVPGAIFAVREGQRTSGRAFLEDALARGAVALLTADASLIEASPVPVITVRDISAAIAFGAMFAYGDPASGLTILGITGTNGKTTTSQLVTSMLTTLGFRAAVIGTLGARLDEASLPSAHTTPEADDLARTFAVLRTLGATHVTMEVSSHALALGRVLAVPFAVTGFLNLTHDHLDFHGDVHAYGHAKHELFRKFPDAMAVINVDDAFGRVIADGRDAAHTLRVSPSGQNAAGLRAFASDFSAAGVSALFETPESHGRIKIKSPLLGAHNLENLAVALGMGVALHLDGDKMGEALSHAPPVPGRLERCSAPDTFPLVVVDYAHTPDALEGVLAALRPVTDGRLHCVFGCGGDRDAQKRPLMGAVAARGADRLIVTNDNPRSEAPESIAEAIVRGIAEAGKTSETSVELDRRAAIRLAIRGAAPGDTVLLAGKGHEPYQIIGDVTSAFDDRDEARDALRELGRVPLPVGTETQTARSEAC
jgi:UDP-N-acetylmuramoyl-L-alanyl-D-glutamate--2,6-diaminopimelate ligase